MKNRTEVLETIQEICRDIFGDSTLLLSDDMTSNDIIAWDSLTHLSLINEIEVKYNIEFTLDEMKSEKKIGTIVNAVMNHLE